MITIVKETASANAITHPNVFHADDVLAAVVLERVLGDVRLCRTRDLSAGILEDAVVFDVGGGKYDHHQPGGNGCRRNGVPYASAGLVWRDFGHGVLGGVPDEDAAWAELDRALFQPIDAADNGMPINPGYAQSYATVSSIVASFNANWDESVSGDEAFLSACSFMRAIFERLLGHVVSKLRAREFVEKAIEESDGRVVFLDRFAPWKDALFASESPKAESALFVIYPDKSNGWNWQCVPDAPGSYGQRLPVPESWRGLTGDALRQVSGIPSAVFCHRGGFMGAARERADAERMVRKAISDLPGC